MSDLAARLREGPTLILDGGLGSLLIARGLPAGAPPERWVLERPDEVRAAHAAYVEAGSDAVHACTFGANPVRLESFGLEEQTGAINRAAVALARASGAGFVIGDVGPTGEHLAPVGTGDPERWREGFLRQGRLLAEAGVDALHVETMIDQREARVALEALLEAAPGVPVLVSLTFDRKKRGFFTAFGDRPTEALGALIDAGATAVGANCSLASRDMRDLAEALLDAASVAAPLVVQPNAGRPVVEGDRVTYAQDPEDFASDLAALARAGVAAVGGCCGTDPGFIHALRARLGRGGGGA